jgi:hypothetical protein
MQTFSQGQPFLIGIERQKDAGVGFESEGDVQDVETTMTSSKGVCSRQPRSFLEYRGKIADLDRHSPGELVCLKLRQTLGGHARGNSLSEFSEPEGIAEFILVQDGKGQWGTVGTDPGDYGRSVDIIPVERKQEAGVGANYHWLLLSWMSLADSSAVRIVSFERSRFTAGLWVQSTSSLAAMFSGMSRATGFPRWVITICSPAPIHFSRLVYRFLRSRTVAVFIVLQLWRT